MIIVGVEEPCLGAHLVTEALLFLDSNDLRRIPSPFPRMTSDSKDNISTRRGDSTLKADSRGVTRFISANLEAKDSTSCSKAADHRRIYEDEVGGP